MKRIGAVALLLIAGALAGGAQELALPNRPASLKFAAIGDFGTGDPPEYDLGRQMTASHNRFPFELVITLGDNLYGRQEPRDLDDIERFVSGIGQRRKVSLCVL